MVCVLVYDLHTVEDCLVDLSIVFALEFDCRPDTSRPLIERISVLGVTLRIVQAGRMAGKHTTAPTSATSDFGTEP